MSSLWAALRRVAETPTGILTVGLAARAAMGAVTVVLLTRSLGLESFGVLGGLVSIATLGGPLAAGLADVSVRRLSSGASASEAASSFLGALAVVVVGGSGVVWLLGALILGQQPSAALLAIATAELLAAGFVDGTSKLWIALDRHRRAALQSVVHGIARLGAATALFVGVAPKSPETYAFLLLGALAVAASLSLGLLWRSLRVKRTSLASAGNAFRESIPFSLSQVTARAQADFDKAMLVRFDLTADNGLYAAGYRVLSYASLPMEAKMASTYPRFFAKGQEGGMSATLELRRQVSRQILILGALAGVVAVAAAPIAAFAFGDRFEGVVGVVFALAGLPLLLGCSLIAADALTGAGYQTLRVRIRVAAVALNVLLNAWLLPRYGWQGAAASTYATEAANLVALRYAGRMLRQREYES